MLNVKHGDPARRDYSALKTMSKSDRLTVVKMMSAVRAKRDAES